MRSSAIELVVIGVVLGGAVPACDGCRGGPARRDAAGARLDGAAAADAAGDALLADASGAMSDAAGAVIDAGAPRDGSGAASDAGAGDAAAAALCPPWQPRAAAGHAWLFARATSDGVPLTVGANHIDVYVRASGAPLPGDRADADDPCAVAAYDRSATRIRVLAAAIGFSSQDREFAPQRCTASAPCEIELPRSLDVKYYVASARGVAVRSASEVAPADRVAFAAALGKDALARARTLQRPLADELDRGERATRVPALDQAIHYTESTLRRRCDASCLDAPALDPAVRGYLRNARRPGQVNPFDLRVAPERWPIRER